MRKFFLPVLLLCAGTVSYSQTLFTYGNEKVSSSEFMRAYDKNKTPVTNREQSLRDYLDLYINFKLKVRAARDMQLDTLPQLEYDLDNFRQQILENYVMDEKVTRQLLEEAFNRSHKDLHVQYFSVYDPADSIRTEVLAADLAEKIRDGKGNYQAIAKEMQENERVTVKYRDLGYLTVFSIAYPFENIVYSLRPGQVSKPFFYKNACHFFRLVDERDAAGKWKTAQIMLALPPDNNPQAVAALERKADSLYKLLKGGADFAKLAKENSEDKMSFSTGGEMAEFGTGHYDASFENVVFSLQKDGDMTAPFRSSFGIHIVKRISVRPVPADFNDPIVGYEMRQQLLGDARMNTSRDKMTRDVVALLAAKRAPGVTDAELMQYIDSIVDNPDNEDDSRFAFSKKTVLQMKGGAKKGVDWLNYYRSLGLSEVPEVSDLWNRFVVWAAMDHYRTHLEEYNTDFKYQIQEFREGNMLFEAMERNVWGKAGTDTAGLEAYYKQNKEKYKWAESADLIIINAQNMEAGEFMMGLMKGSQDWRELTENMEEIQADSGRYELSQITALSNGVPEEGGFSAITKNTDGSVSFVRVLKTYPTGQQRNFDDARGLVINDYQVVLEKKWIEELRKKYPVKVNEAVFMQLVKSK